MKKNRWIRTRFRLVCAMASLTGNRRVIAYKIVLGTMILGTMGLQACHPKKKTMCYYFMMPDPVHHERAEGFQNPSPDIASMDVKQAENQD
jgi:hypothetical protein